MPVCRILYRVFPFQAPLQCFDSRLFRFRPHVGVTLQHLLANVSCHRADRLFRDSWVLKQTGDEGVSKVMPPQLDSSLLLGVHPGSL